MEGMQSGDISWSEHILAKYEEGVYRFHAESLYQHFKSWVEKTKKAMLVMTRHSIKYFQSIVTRARLIMVLGL